MDRKIRVLVAKSGLDGHDRGAKVIARALRDAGMPDRVSFGISTCIRVDSETHSGVKICFVPHLPLLR